MLTHLSLRFRVFLFFCLLALGGVVLVLGALWLGFGRVPQSSISDGFIFAGIVAGLGLIGLVTGIWLLFDEHVAKPIEALAAQMRARAHAGVDSDVDTSAAKYLGDLAPAASAVTSALGESTLSAAEKVARETQRLAKDTAQLTALLSEIPVATLLVNTQGLIVLYDGQAAEVLAQLGVPRLNAPLTDYFDSAALNAAVAKLQKTGLEVRFTAEAHDASLRFDTRLKPLESGYMMVIDAERSDLSPEAARPLVYDFDLLRDMPSGTHLDHPLSRLTYTVFDTETTGLLPHKDEIVQIGAVRVVNGRIVPGERINQLVDPGCPIPPASTKVHHVTDAMVQGAPGIDRAGRQFHTFASNSVIVAHNAPFDMAFLRRHRAAMGVEWDHPILDTVLLSAVLFGASQTHTLDALCDRLGVSIPPELRHTALGDAQATAEVLVKMLPMLEARGLRTFEDVLTETKRHGRLLEDLN
jgi:DNA polymerase-3 subunit epsilon